MQAAITNKPHNFSGLTQWKFVSSLLKCPMQGASSMHDCCVPAISYRSCHWHLAGRWQKWRNGKRVTLQKAWLWNDTHTFINISLAKPYSFNHIKLQGRLSWHPPLWFPKRKKMCILLRKKQSLLLWPKWFLFFFFPHSYLMWNNVIW